MSDVVIRVENLSKEYRLGTIGSNTLRVDVSRWWAKWRGQPDPTLKVGQTDHGNRNGEQIWALRDINLEVKQGEVLGIIGRNGAGKSTLLKILSRVTAPTSGDVKVKGRIASLLEVGTGFHPELTGRENIYLNGAILGMRKSEIDRKFDEIVDFSGVEKFIDTPVKRYSSGMYVRLAFAVAAHLEPEILVVDEVLAVGDAEFQKKCLGKMGEVAKEGRTVLFVSHNLAAVESLCTKSVLFDRGRIKFSGSAFDAIRLYLDRGRDTSAKEIAQREDRAGNGQIRVQYVTLQVDDPPILDHLITGRDAKIAVGYKGEIGVRNLSISLGFYGAYGQFLLLCNNEMAGTPFNMISENGEVICHIPRCPFSPGSYSLNIYCEVNGLMADWVQEAKQVTVVEGDFYGTGKLPSVAHGGFLVDQHWIIN